MPIKLIAQTTNDSTTVKTTDIRTANQIFSEHKTFKDVIVEQKVLIKTLHVTISEDSLIKQRLYRSISLKDSAAVAQRNIQLVKESEHKRELKEQKRKTFKAYTVAAVSLIISIALLAL